MKRTGIILIAVVGLIAVPAILWVISQRANLPDVSTVSPIASFTAKRTLDRYTIDALSTRIPEGTDLKLENAIATTSAYTSYKFSFLSEGKRVTGWANIPNGLQPGERRPTIVQFRGFVDRAQFETGVGTRRSGEVYAANGFITFAPDFLGYGGSDQPSEDVFEERFQTYIVALDLLSAVQSFPGVDPGRIGIWGHSNGGHIALATLEILKKPYPTTLWAPVTKPFPYSILYFTDEFEDGGKMLRKLLARFEEHYDTDRYSLTQYLEYIQAPILLHQGTADDAVPLEWSNEFAQRMETLEKQVTYYTYPGADHNLSGGWNTVVERDIEFFNSHLSP